MTHGVLWRGKETIRGPFYYSGLTLVPACLSHFIPHFIMDVITYPRLDWNWSMLVKGPMITSHFNLQNESTRMPYFFQNRHACVATTYHSIDTYYMYSDDELITSQLLSDNEPLLVYCKLETCGQISLTFESKYIKIWVKKFCFVKKISWKYRLHYFASASTVC